MPSARMAWHVLHACVYALYSLYMTRGIKCPKCVDISLYVIRYMMCTVQCIQEVPDSEDGDVGGLFVCLFGACVPDLPRVCLSVCIGRKVGW
ncbi:hypothetical protein IWX49DRAFT_577097 [Phyllosticta citricarpa]